MFLIEKHFPHNGRCFLLPKSGKIKLMSTLFSDTHPKMETLQIEIWRSASPTKKMELLAQLNHSAKLLALTGLRSQYPECSESELRRRFAGRLLGEEIACKVYGELPYAKRTN